MQDLWNGAREVEVEADVAVDVDIEVEVQVEVEVEEVKSTPVVKSTNLKLSPVVRKLASENNVDLEQVTGTGSGGRITRKDIESFITSESQTVQKPKEVESDPDTKKRKAEFGTDDFWSSMIKKKN